MLHQAHQLHGQPVSPDGVPQEHSRGVPSACMFEPTGTVCRSFDQRLATLRSIGECVSEYELSLLLKKITVPVCYVWCDLSPWMHITQGISMTSNVNKMVEAGFQVKILMADWFARMNPQITRKVGSDLSNIQTIGRYNIEVWKAIGMNLDGVEVVQLSDKISCKTDEYWSLAMDIARKSDMSRIKSWLRVYASKDPRGSPSIDPYMSRDFSAAEIVNPCLQSAGILLQKADVWLLNLDQRGGHILARQYCKHMERENIPIAFFHNVLPNLLEHPGFGGCNDPRWTIFIEDSEEEVCSKIEDAFCPLKNAKGNPCLEYIKYIVLPWFGKFEVLRTGENSGIKTFMCMEELAADYKSGALHPVDVKQALVKAINMMLQPVRDHFSSNAEGKELKEAMQIFNIDIWVAPSACMFKPNNTVCGSFDQRLATLRSVDEHASEDELRLLLKKKTAPICHVWCDPSPWMTINQGISMTINVNKLVKAGCKVKMLMADWFALMDPKIGGNICKVQTIGRYNIEMLRASGMILDGVEFVQLSDLISCHAEEYFPVAMDIARNSDLSEIKRCFSIHASEDASTGYGSTDPFVMRKFTPADTLYPCLQSAVILLPEVDIWMLGMDQRGPNMLAREYCDLMQLENEQIALFQNMPPDFLQDPEWEEWGNLKWPIFMEDDEEHVRRKIENAFCPLKFAEDNPCLEYIKYIILPWFRKFEVVRMDDNSCSKIFLSMEEIIADYKSGALHPADLKVALIKATNLILQPVRDHFRSSAEAKEIAKAMKEIAPSITACDQVPLNNF